MAKQTFTAGQVLTAAEMNSLQENDYNWTVSTKTASYTLAAGDEGTRIVMDSASATTVTVDDAIFAAGDTVWIHNIGAGTCTVTAGTATVNSNSGLAISQYGGASLYFTSPSAAILFPSNNQSVASYSYVQTVYFTTSSTFVKADYPWLRMIRVRLCGAGGGGGAAQVTSAGEGSAGSGGGGGGGSEFDVTDIAGLSASETITVGAGGAGGTPASPFGSGGGDTTAFGVTGYGSGGGASYLQSSFPHVGVPVSPTGGSSGRVYAGAGSEGSFMGDSGNYKQLGGAGGESFLSVRTASIRSGTSAQTGRTPPASAPGAGGSGAAGPANDATGADGGDGADGIVILELYA